jgi:RNA polymerase subunit RPABC4/transcription elongation factor Spt4
MMGKEDGNAGVTLRAPRGDTMSEPEQACPKCGSTEVLPIHYGLIEEPSDGTWIAGGCCVPPDWQHPTRTPFYACKTCESTWDEEGLCFLGASVAEGWYPLRSK